MIYQDPFGRERSNTHRRVSEKTCWYNPSTNIPISRRKQQYTTAKVAERAEYQQLAHKAIRKSKSERDKRRVSGRTESLFTEFGKVLSERQQTPLTKKSKTATDEATRLALLAKVCLLQFSQCLLGSLKLYANMIQSQIFFRDDNVDSPHGSSQAL